MAEDCNKGRDPRTIRRSNAESQREGKDINCGDGNGKAHSKRDYKLLIDPAIKKGHQKIYRYDGHFPGQPPVIPRDPRPPRTKLWTTTVADLPIPRFKVDKYYVGALPETTIRFGCLNDNINRQFLRELCSKFGKIEECKVYYDLKSKKHLGTGKITFSTTSAAREALSELDGSSVMGNIIRVSIDRKKQSQHNSLQGPRPVHGSKDPREYRDPRRLSADSSQSVLPTPSPSQYSPSVESTPPTPLVSGMHRPHPVAHLKPTLQLRRGSSHDSDLNTLESPASICSASFNSASFEPISPPPPGKFLLLNNDSASFPPPPPPGKGSSLPPHPNLPPPPPPAKQEIYEDISPLATFDDVKKSPVAENEKDPVADSKFVQAHLLGLKIACGVEAKDSRTDNKLGSPSTHSAVQRRNEKIHQQEHTRLTSQESKSSRKDEKRDSATRIDTSTARLDKKSHRSDRPLSREISPLHSHNYPSHRDRDSSRSPYNRNSTERTSSTPRGVSPGRAPASKTRPGRDVHDKSKLPDDLRLSSGATPVNNALNESVYEEISDSDDEGKNNVNSIQGVTLKNLQVEDISPANSPVTKNVSNGMSLIAGPPSTIQNMELPKSEMVKDGARIENEDDDDAMSLSSISSNDESALVLNTPVTKVNIPVAVSSSASFHQMSYSKATQQFPPARQTINMAGPPGPPSNITRPSNRPGLSNIPGPPPPSLNIPSQSRMNVAPPPPMNLARPPPVNVHQAPPLNVRQAPQNQMMPPSHRLPPPPHVNIHVPPPRMTYNQNIRNPYAQPPSQPPQMGASQPSISSFPQRSANSAGGFIGSYSRPYSGFIPGNYPNYRDYNMPQGRHIPEIVKEIPYEERVRKASNLKTKKDLKMVLHRDLIKRLVEHSGFAALEAWWDNQTKKLSASNASRPARPASLAHSHVSQSTTANVSSSSSSTTSSLLSSLFGRSHQGTPSSSLSSPSSHNAMQKIPSFRINRMPQGRPMGREPLNKRLKREALERGAEVENKRKRVDDKPVSEESESESESDSEVERSLLASTRPVVKSGASLYRTIYESSAEEEDSEKEDVEKEVKPKTSDDEDDDKKFQELLEEEKLKKERLKQAEVDQKSQEDEEMATEDDEEEESMSEDEEEVSDEEAASDEEEASDGDEAEDEESSEEEGEEEEDAGSEWESSGAEEAVKEVIKETEIRLEQFKEKSLKHRKQDFDKLEHDRKVEEYLKRTYEPRTKTKENYKEKKRDNLLIDKENEKSLVNQRKGKNDLKLSENDKIVEQSLMRKEAVVLERVVFEERKDKKDLVKNKEKGRENTVIEETIEETEIVSRETDLDTSNIKDEIISEEVIKIEPEEPIEEVFNEHCYASFNSGFKKESLELVKKETDIEKLETDRKSPSPIIEIVEEIEDEKDFYVNKEPEPKPFFPMRSIEDENISVWNILQHGIDKEDLEYMKTAFENLESFGSGVVKDLHWAKHPETFLQTKQKRIKGEPNLRAHKTGCARSEGHYNIPFSEKIQYLSSVMRQLEVAYQKIEQDADGSKHKQQSRDNRAIQRRLVSSFVNDDFGDLVKFNKLKTRKKGLKFAKSGIHNWGLFTCEPIAAEEMVIEYVGEIVRSVIADAREKYYEQTGIGSSYLFRLDAETVIDATKVGNNARFINHSCAPNCYAKIINVENEKKIVIYSKTDIKLNDEITYDYKFPIEDEKIKCLCGTPQCRGTLN